MYDYLIVGAGLFGAVCARQLTDAGRSVLVIDRRPHVGGNIYTEKTEGINVHVYGAHIFHTNNRKVWNYITRFAEFNRFTNSPVANYKGELYSLPFNMYTFNKMWGVVTPEEASRKIEEQRKESRRTGHQPDRAGPVRKACKGVYRKTVGQGLQGASRLYYQETSRQADV